VTAPREAFPGLLLCLLLFSSSFSAECAGWKIKFDGSDSDPVIADGVLYVGSADGAVYALDPADGATKWRFQTGEGLTSGPQIITLPRKGAVFDEMVAKGINAPRQGKKGIDLTPVVRKGTVFIGSGDFSFYALDAVTGEKKWSYAAESKIAGSAVYEDGTAYIVTEKGLHAIDATTGQKKWLFETLQEIPPQQMNDVRRLGKRPALGPVRGEKALFLTAWPFRLSTTPQKGFVYAVSPDSGTTRWVTAIEGLDIREPVAARGLVFVTAEDPRSPPRPGNPLGASSSRETLYAINAEDGQIKWRLGAERAYGRTRLLIAGNTIYFKTDRKLIAAELETGRPLWSFGAEDIQGDLKVDEHHLYVATHKGTIASPDDTLHALALATGQEKWSRRVGGGASLRMVHEGVVYAGGADLYALDAAAGTRLWSFEEVRRSSARLIFGGRIFAISPTVTYFGTSKVDQGYLYSLDARTGKP
jgi:outer membrane protein assembly factor BamB